jgi:hypothetical protein
MLIIAMIVFVGFKSWRSNTLMSSDTQKTEIRMINESPKETAVTIFSATMPKTRVELKQQTGTWWQKKKSAPVNIPFMLNEENILFIEQNGETNSYRVMINPMDFNENSALIIKSNGNVVLRTGQRGHIDEQNIPASRQ